MERLVSLKPRRVARRDGSSSAGAKPDRLTVLRALGARPALPRAAGLGTSSRMRNPNPAGILLLTLLLSWFQSPAFAQPGNLDPGFNPGANDQVYAVVVQPDGRILVGGAFWGLNEGFQGYVARLREDGTPDPEFRSPFPALSTGPVTALAVQTDGRILVAGQLAAPGQHDGHGVFRLFADGTLDPEFVANTDQLAFASGVAAYPDGRVLVTAWTTAYPGVLRFAANGALDSSFNPGLGEGGLAVLVQPNNQAIVGGTFGVVRLNNSGALDGSFGAAVEGAVSALARQSDGRLVVAGGFSSVGGVRRVGVARLGSNGQLDSSFDPGDGPNGWVSAVAVQADGKVIIGGQFTTVAGVARNSVARLRSNGQLDPEFDIGAGADHEVRALVMDASGRTVIGGLFTHFEGQTRARLARLTADGSANPGFIEVATPQQTALEDAGAVTVGLRRFSGRGGAVSVRVSAVPEQAVAGEDFVFEPVVVTFADGEAAASVTVPLVVDAAIEGTETFRVALDEPSGGAVLGESRQTQVFIENDDYGATMRFAEMTANEISGKVVVHVLRAGATGAAFTVNYDLEAETAAAREDYVPTQGTLEFGPTATAMAIDVALPDDDRAEGEETFVVHLRDPSSPASVASPASTRVRVRDNEAAGGLDPTFAPLLSSTVVGLAQQADGALIVLTNGAVRPVRIAPTGAIEPGYASTVSNVGPLLLVDRANRLLYTTTNRFARTNGVVRLLEDGLKDPAFKASAGADGGILTMLELPDRSLLVGGSFTRVNGQNRRSLARLLEAGEFDASFDAALSSPASVYALARQPDGRILIGGQFSGVGGASRRGVARLEADGKVDTSFLSRPGAGTSSEVLALAVQADGGVLVGGEFTSFSTLNRSHLVRLDSAGSVDTGFGRTGPLLALATGGTPAIEAIRVQPDGGILVRGNFTRIMDVPRTGLARLLTDGQVDLAFDPGDITRLSNLAGDVTALELTADGRVVIGGQFNTVGGASRSNLARLYTQYPLPAALAILSSGFTLEGRFRVRFRTASPGRYALEGTDDLRGWDEITVTPPITGEGEVVDSAPPPDRRFYRVAGPRP